MNFFLMGVVVSLYNNKVHVTSYIPKPTLVLNLMDKKNAQTPPTIGLLSSHHHPSNPIATEKSRTASLRLDLPVCTLVTSNTLKRFSREPYSTSPTHAGTRVCVRRKWRQAQHTGAGLFCQLIATMGMSQKNIFRVRLFTFSFLSFFLSQLEFDFFSPLRRAEVEIDGLPVFIWVPRL